MSGNSSKSSWRRVKFGDVVRLSGERCADPATAGIERYVGLEHIEPEDLRIRRWGRVADGTTFTNLFRPGQVLFGKRRAYQRKVAVADFEGVCSGDIYVLEPKNPAELLPELLPYICQTEGFYEHAVGTSAGSLSPRTNWTQLAQYEFALPPVEEQAKVCVFLRASTQVLLDLQNLHQKLENLYDSWLADTFVRAEALGSKRRVDQVCKEVTVGIVVNPSKYYSSAGVLAISHSSINRGEIDPSGAARISTSSHEQLRKTWLYEGDLVLPRVSTILGRPYYASVVPPELNEINAIGIVILRPNSEKALPLFLEACFNSPHMQRRLLGIAVGSIQRQLNVGIISAETVPVPPLGFQRATANDSAQLKAAIRTTKYRVATQMESNKRLREAAMSNMSRVNR